MSLISTTRTIFYADGIGSTLATSDANQAVTAAAFMAVAVWEFYWRIAKPEKAEDSAN